MLRATWDSMRYWQSNKLNAYLGQLAAQALSFRRQAQQREVSQTAPSVINTRDAGEQEALSCQVHQHAIAARGGLRSSSHVRRHLARARLLLHASLMKPRALEITGSALTAIADPGNAARKARSYKAPPPPVITTLSM